MTCLLYVIKTDSLDTVKENITQDRKPLRYYERCVNFYKDFIKQSIGNQSNVVRRVVEVSLHKKCNDGVKYRYYSKEEYKKLSTNYKEKPWKIHEGCPQGGRPRGGGEKGNKPHTNIRKFEKKAKKLQRTIKKLEAK